MTQICDIPACENKSDIVGLDLNSVSDSFKNVNINLDSVNLCIKCVTYFNIDPDSVVRINDLSTEASKIYDRKLNEFFKERERRIDMENKDISRLIGESSVLMSNIGEKLITGDIPLDHKIEFDKLIFEIEPMATRMMDLLNELPYDSGKKIVLQYDGFTLTMEKA